MHAKGSRKWAKIICDSKKTWVLHAFQDFSVLEKKKIRELSIFFLEQEKCYGKIHRLRNAL